jgi:hypothetical protein
MTTAQGAELAGGRQRFGTQGAGASVGPPGEQMRDGSADATAVLANQSRYQTVRDNPAGHIVQAAIW